MKELQSKEQTKEDKNLSTVGNNNVLGQGVTPLSNECLKQVEPDISVQPPLCMYPSPYCMPKSPMVLFFRDFGYLDIMAVEVLLKRKHWRHHMTLFLTETLCLFKQPTTLSGSKRWKCITY